MRKTDCQSILGHSVVESYAPVTARAPVTNAVCPLSHLDLCSVKEDIWWQAVTVPGVTLIGTWCSAVSSNPSAALHEGTPISTQLMRRASSEITNG